MLQVDKYCLYCDKNQYIIYDQTRSVFKTYSREEMKTLITVIMRKHDKRLEKDD